MGRDVVLVSSADETAFEVRRLLLEGRRRWPAPGSAGPAAHRFALVGRRRAGSADLGARLLGPELDRAPSADHRWPPERPALRTVGPEVGPDGRSARIRP